MLSRSFFPNFDQGPFPKIAGKSPAGLYLSCLTASKSGFLPSPETVEEIGAILFLMNLHDILFMFASISQLFSLFSVCMFTLYFVCITYFINNALIKLLTIYIY